MTKRTLILLAVLIIFIWPEISRADSVICNDTIFTETSTNSTRGLEFKGTIPVKSIRYRARWTTITLHSGNDIRMNSMQPCMLIVDKRDSTDNLIWLNNAAHVAKNERTIRLIPLPFQPPVD